VASQLAIGVANVAAIFAAKHVAIGVANGAAEVCRIQIPLPRTRRRSAWRTGQRGGRIKSCFPARGGRLRFGSPPAVVFSQLKFSLFSAGQTVLSKSD
jgi:hypothetical protein